MGFTKLHAVILDSSVWQEPLHVRIVWITMLAMADANGIVSASVGGLAHRARVTREECLDALKRFLGPDQDSRDGTTGERIEEVTGGWLILNHSNYRDKQTRQQEMTAVRVRRHRERKRDGVALRNACNAFPPSEAEAEAEAEAEKLGSQLADASPVPEDGSTTGPAVQYRKTLDDLARRVRP